MGYSSPAEAPRSSDLNSFGLRVSSGSQGRGQVELSAIWPVILKLSPRRQAAQGLQQAEQTVLAYMRKPA